MITAYWCVLVASVLPIATIGVAKATGGYDNANPRVWLAQQSGVRQRADFAHRNHFEAFPLFAVSVLVAASVHADLAWLNLLAGAFIALRLAYTAAYLANLATLRSTLWLCAYGVVIAIFLLAGLTR